MRSARPGRLPGYRALILLACPGIGACSAGSVDRVSMPTTKAGPFVAGYHAYWTEDAWTAYSMELLDELFVFELEIGSDGRIADPHGWPDRWRAMTERAITTGVQVVPTVSMHDPEAFEALFSSHDGIASAAETVMGLLTGTPGLSGVHLDFEVFQPVSGEARDGFSAFVTRLGEAMRRQHPGLSLSVFTLAFDDDDVYDEQVLGEVADYLVVQGYDYYSAGSLTAGPIGALDGWGRLNWRGVVERFDGFGVPRRKLVMSVPLYGYEWPVESDAPGSPSRGEGITLPYTAPPDILPDRPRGRDQALAHGLRRDLVSGSPWYAYEDENGWRQGWFEDVESLRSKYDFVRAEGLGGIALFPLAYADEAMWIDLRRAFGGRRAPPRR